MATRADEITERLLVDAGITTGMRVLDVGCGRGDVSFLIARLVGPQGQVVGVDRDPAPLVVARQRAHDLGLAGVTFVEGDLCPSVSGQAPFDAAVWRRVLMYQPDAVAAVRRVADALRPGGLTVLQEHDSLTASTAFAPLPLQQRVHGWMWGTVEREGANIHMGFDLATVLTRAGLLVERVRAEAIVQTATQHHPVGPILQAMLPRIVRHGVASAEEMGIDTIDQRLLEERQQANATYMGELVFGAWARTPLQSSGGA